ncbi:hypothetical protein AUQ39_05480 [Lacticaseibacillus casei]|nr:hypothetical protein AUQ39_05480 [Lacticaseibacillus casei]
MNSRQTEVVPRKKASSCKQSKRALFCIISRSPGAARQPQNAFNKMNRNHGSKVATDLKEEAP